MAIKMPNLGAVANKLKELVPNTGDFADTKEELEQRGESQTPPVEAPPQEAAAPELPLDTEAPPPAEAPVPQAAAPEAPPDPWADYDELEIDDDDVGEKYKIRAPKSVAAKVKNGYARKSAMSRATGYLSKYKTLLEPLITSGRFDTVAQIIELGERPDAVGENFRNAMYEAYYRATMGRPLTFADQVAAAQAAAPQPVAQPTPQDDPNDPLGLKALVQEAVAPVAKDAASFKAWQENQEKQAQMRAWYDNTRIQASNQTYRDFSQMFPDQFSGNEQQDWPNMQRVFNYAKNAGWFEREGADKNPALMPVAMLKAKLDMDRDTTQAIAAPPPSAALSAAQAAEAADRTAREAAAAVAASQGGGGTATPAARVPKREKPPLKDKNGKPLSLTQIAAYYKE